MLKADKRSLIRRKAKYGHQGSGSSHTRLASDAEVRRHIQKAKHKPTITVL